MSRYSIIQAVALQDTRLSPRDITILAAIGCYADKNGDCYPSTKTLGEIFGISRQAASKSIKTLSKCGYLTVSERRRSNNSQTSNGYHINMDYIPDACNLRQISAEKHPHPLQPQVAPPATSEVAPPATSEVAPPATSEVAPIRNLINDPSEEESGSSKKKRNTAVMPETINTAAWNEFEEHRKSIRKPLTDLARKKAWNLIAGLTHGQQQSVIDYSITGRYPGLYPDRLVGNKNPESTRPALREL